MLETAVQDLPIGRFRQRWLLGYQADPQTGNDIWLISSDGSEARPVLAGPDAESNAMFSPDGNWVVYQSQETGRSELYAVSFPDFSNRRQITTTGGFSPEWASEAGELVYRGSGGSVQAMRYDLSTGFRTEGPETLFSFDGLFDFQVSPDAQRFFLLVEDPAAPAREIRVIQGWFEELERVAPN